MTDPIQQTLDYLCRIFPGGDASPDAAAAWRLACYDVAPEVLREAAIEYTRTPGKRFFPTPGELLEVAASWGGMAEVPMTLARAKEVSAGKSWAELDPGVREVIVYFGVDAFRAVTEPTLAEERHWGDACAKQHTARLARERGERRQLALEAAPQQERLT